MSLKTRNYKMTVITKDGAVFVQELPLLVTPDKYIHDRMAYEYGIIPIVSGDGKIATFLSMDNVMQIDFVEIEGDGDNEKE